MQQAVMNGQLVFDLWRNGRWIGMVEGKTPEEARKHVETSGLQKPESIMMIPFYGTGMSVSTYETLTGMKSKSIEPPNPPNYAPATK